MDVLSHCPQVIHFLEHLMVCYYFFLQSSLVLFLMIDLSL